MAKSNLFNSIKVAAPNSNVFDLSHDVKMSLNMGYITPIMCLEAVPGDKFNISCESLLRFAPLVSPVMHRMDVTMHYFFCPNRLLWPDWEDFITGNGNIPPYLTITVMDDEKSLSNYLGLPVLTGANTADVSAFPFAAYQRIYNDYYRDQNLIPEVVSQLFSGDCSSINDLYVLRKRAWEHDYFTSALPNPQSGAAGVSIPVTLTDAPIAMKNVGTTAPGFFGVQSSSGPGAVPMGVEVANVGTHPTMANNQFFADNTNVGTTTTINDLRRSFRLQEWLEKNARGGKRYIEHILSHFGVRSSDARLDRPEYITGTKSPVVISEVLNTTGETSPTTGLPQGNMAGHAISVTAGKYGNYYCEEHGYIIGVMTVMPKTAYQQGIPKHFLKTDALDYYWPSFANIGEQEILNKELYAEHSAPNAVFGYIPRYSEYKNQPSRVAGDFRTTLDFWHLGRIFGPVEPNLNQSFVECDPSRRIFAVTAPQDHQLYAHVLNKVRAVRKMPVFGTPTF